MRFFRQIIGDRMSGGPLAVLLCVLIVLQGLLADRTMAAMEAMGPDHGQIICGSHGVESLDHGQHDDHLGQVGHNGHQPAEQSRKDCCLAACQVVQGFVAGLAQSFVVLADGWPASGDADVPVLAQSHVIARNVPLSLGARGPPSHLSV